MNPAGESSESEDQIQMFLRLYKLPLLLGIASIFLIGIASVVLVRSFSSVRPIEFSEGSASSSGTVALTMIQVDVEGAVAVAGVYSLQKGARVDDLLKTAGGLTGEADSTFIEQKLNRAAILADGAKLYIPRTGEIETSHNYESSTAVSITSHNDGTSNRLGEATVNINSASQILLESLPGVGPVTAGKIIAGRPYQTAQDLVVKKAVGPALFEKIKNLISL
jgi:competence protein ComEA